MLKKETSLKIIKRLFKFNVHAEKREKGKVFVNVLGGGAWRQTPGGRLLAQASHPSNSPSVSMFLISEFKENKIRVCLCILHGKNRLQTIIVTNKEKKD